MRGAVSSGSWHNYINSQKKKRKIILLIEKSFLLGLSKGNPKIKMPFVFFFLRSVTNRLLGPKTHASLLIVSDKGERTWLKKWWIYQASSLKGSTNTTISSTHRLRQTHTKRFKAICQEKIQVHADMRLVSNKETISLLCDGKGIAK